MARNTKINQPAAGKEKAAAQPVAGTVENAPQAGAGAAIQEVIANQDQLPPVVTEATVVVTTSDDGQVKETVVQNEGDASGPEGNIDLATLTEEEKENAVDGAWVEEKLSPYLKAYPNENLFHITSDGQVFLGKDETFAKEHQKTLKDGGIVHSFTVEKAN